jgi:hypothetical protein
MTGNQTPEKFSATSANAAANGFPKPPSIPALDKKDAGSTILYFAFCARAFLSVELQSF